MDPQANTPSSWEESWKALQSSVSIAENVPVLAIAVYMVLGGLLALYLRILYRHCNSSFSGADSVARIFPQLTMVTIGVIAVVKSSLALSLGLVGALSFVRFRAAIKAPEELVYLFLCIGVGLALGAEQPLLAVAMVIVTTVFVLGVVNALVGRYTLQRLDLEQERGQMRIAISRRGDADTSKLVAALREQLPECEFSYVNLESTL